MWLRPLRRPRYSKAIDEDTINNPPNTEVLGGDTLLFWSNIMLAVAESKAAYAARLIEVLLMAGVPKDFADDEGNTALHLALSSHKMDIVQVLLNREVDVNHPNALRITPLMLAAREGSDVMLQLLIEKKADINSARNNGWTALMYAAQSGYGDNVKVLLHARADVSRVDFRGFTALDYAKEGGFGDTVKALLGDAEQRQTNADDDVEGPFEDDINYAIQAATEDNGIPDDFGSDEE
jgi:ankyrin repeat protein